MGIRILTVLKHCRCSPGGAGHALALEFAARDMRVFATARSTKSLSELEAKGIEVLPLEVTSAESIAALKAEIAKRTGGKLDMLFNNAGTSMLLSLCLSLFTTTSSPGRTNDVG